MCSCTSVSQSASTTWTASVPRDLADTIAAAVGVQPVKAQAPLKLPVQEQPQQQMCRELQQQTPDVSSSDVSLKAEIAGASFCCSTGSAQALHSFNAGVTANTCNDLRSNLARRQPVSVSRPTTAGICATLPTSCNDFERLSDSVSSSDAGLIAASRPSQQQSWGACAASSSSRWAALYDDMDDLQPAGAQEDQLGLFPHSRSPSSSERECEAAYQELQHLDMHSSSGGWEPFSESPNQAEQQLMCQLWSQLQMPMEPAGDLAVAGQYEHMAAVPPGSNSDSCCSDDEAHGCSWPPVYSSIDSSYSSTDASSSMIAAYSRASSICSSSSSRRSNGEKRVSWGSVTEYQLPTEPQYSWLWRGVPCWLHMPSSWDGKTSAAGSGRAGPAAVGAAAAGLVVAATGAAVLAYSRRLTSA